MSAANASGPLVVLVMGVTGAGKSHLGAALAQRLHADFQDSDAFHSAANIAKMGNAIALTDADRAPWLAAVRSWIVQTLAAGRRGVTACSALRRVYRRVLIAPGEPIALVHLDGDIETVRARLKARRGHFMALDLLASQQATLEAPALDEGALVVDIAWPVDRQVDFIVARLALDCMDE